MAKNDSAVRSVTMTAPSQLTHDVLTIIGSYWDGIGLGLTCKRLVHLLDPDRHVIIHERDVGTVSRLPNKWLHGESVLDAHGGLVRAYIGCDRSAVISVTVTGPSGRVCAHHGVYRGYAWTWTHGSVYLYRDPLSRKICTDEEIASALVEITRGMPAGRTRTLNAYTWPGLIFCAIARRVDLRALANRPEKMASAQPITTRT